MRLLMVFVVCVLKKHGFDYDVSGECDRCDTEAGEGALEAVPSCERASVSPGLTMKLSIPLTYFENNKGHTFWPTGRFWGCKHWRRAS
jgi:hypothetical protein